jgi:hypothetical protein
VAQLGVPQSAVSCVHNSVALRAWRKKRIDRWRTLCEQAAKEEDLGRLLHVVREINRMLIKRLLLEREQSVGKVKNC